MYNKPINVWIEGLCKIFLVKLLNILAFMGLPQTLHTSLVYYNMYKVIGIPTYYCYLKSQMTNECCANVIKVAATRLTHVNHTKLLSNHNGLWLITQLIYPHAQLIVHIITCILKKTRVISLPYNMGRKSSLQKRLQAASSCRWQSLTGKETLVTQKNYIHIILL